MSSRKHTVIVTGFGPFHHHEVNASAMAVRELMELELKDHVNLIIVELPVEYDAVREIVPLLWKEHSPLLVVHVGLSSTANQLALEQLAHNGVYSTPDTLGKCPVSGCCVANDDPEHVLRPAIDMGVVCASVNAFQARISSCMSNDAGRYLCDYCFYLSLNESPNAAFVHVPPLHLPYTSMEIAVGLQQAIFSMIEQLSLKQL